MKPDEDRSPRLRLYQKAISDVNMKIFEVMPPSNDLIHAPSEPKLDANPRFRRGHDTGSKRQKATSPIISNGPITPSEAKKAYSNFLTSYELHEIDDFEEIYFVGHLNTKIRPRSCPSSNFGYDNAEHHLIINKGDQLAFRFEVKQVLGKGSFGQVLLCYDHKLQKNVAIKVIINTPQMYEQGCVEVALLQHLNNSDPGSMHSIVQSYDCFIFRNHVCATFEVLGKNLYEYSRSIAFKPFRGAQLKSVAKQMLTALDFCHSHGVLHCDIKPENIAFLPGSSMNCRLIDFGSGCFKGREKYEYIQSRFYRAPEVILGVPYDTGMDIWSFACVIIELIIGRPIFPGNDEHEMIEMMMSVLGPVPQSLLKQSSRRDVFFNSNGSFIYSRKNQKRLAPGSFNIRTATRIKDNALLSLLEKCLQWDQNKRISASEALNHPWFDLKEVLVPTSARAPGLPSLSNKVR